MIKDLDKDDYIPEPYKAAPVEEVFELHKQEQALKKKQNKSKEKKLQALGFEGEVVGESIL